MREKTAFRAGAGFTAAVLTGWVLVAGGGSAAAGGPAWTIEKSPNVTTPNGQLESVSCSSATACTAVGSYVNVSGIQVTLAERWNGTIWRQQRTPNPAVDTVPAVAPSLRGVSCPTADFCEAVGAYQPGGQFSSPGDQLGIAEKWNGHQWRWQRLPIPVGAGDAQLDAVSCTSPRFCEAVGTDSFAGQTGQTLAETWNGSSWRVQHTPNPPPSNFGEPAVLNGVSCASRSFCEAVGGGIIENPGTAVAERWNGTSWRLQAVRATALMDAVSCVSARFCEAVGSGGGDRWNGKSWKPQVFTAALAGAPTGVSCVSPTFCEAVAQNFNSPQPDLAAVWNGSMWKAQATPSPAGAFSSRFLAVTCLAARSCEAVGTYGLTQINPTPLPLAEAWTGRSWRLRHAAAPLGATASALNSVSCVSATFCEAVGGLAERWNGTSWRIQATPADGGAFSVSCVSARFCEAVGVGAHGPDAEEWNGTSWRLQTRPGFSVEPEAVSCATVSFCMAVDGFADVDIWNGSSWSAGPTPTALDFLGPVSCLSATFCEAVGGTRFSGEMAATWNGTSWSTQALAGTASANLEAISCTAVTSCEAVGSYFNPSSSEIKPLAELWNGTAWSLQPIPTPPVAQFSMGGVLSGLSCTTAGRCAAVGSYQFRQISPFRPFAEVWNGTSWSLSYTPSSANASSSLSGVSCPAASKCTAVGQTADDGGTEAALIETGG